VLAWLAAALFFIAFLISGGGLNPSTAWLHPLTLIAAGLCCAVLSGAVSPPWGRRG
jgi:hypothetical protein